MTPAARYQASIDLWDKNCTQTRVPMDSVCGDYFRLRKFIGSKDRSNIAERVYNMMRAYARLGWWCSHLGLNDTPRSRVLLASILIDGLTSDDLPNLFNGNKYHPDILNDDEMAAVKKIMSSLNLIEASDPLVKPKYDIALLNHPDMPEQVLAECPEWAYDRLKSIFKDNFQKEMAAMLMPATLDIRVNTLKIDRAEAKALLAKDDIESDLCPYSPVGLRLKSKSYLAHSKAFKKGLIEIQDEGSQLLALICGARAGMQVIDYCAGGGGKTLALAATMGGKGRIIAMDIDEKRLAKAKPRLTKADVHNVELRTLSDDKHRKWLRRQKENFDIVLVDAPCSSSGTWRRNPDLKWNHYGPQHSEIETVQAEILERVYETVKPGGKLIYATCSLFSEENENQVNAFLKNHPEFKLVPTTTAWTDAGLPAPCPIDADMMRLSPAHHQTDGFFAAVMQKAAS